MDNFCHLLQVELTSASQLHPRSLIRAFWSPDLHQASRGCGADSKTIQGPNGMVFHGFSTPSSWDPNFIVHFECKKRGKKNHCPMHWPPFSGSQGCQGAASETHHATVRPRRSSLQYFHHKFLASLNFCRLTKKY